jgi:hypothetical protein
VIKDSLFNSVVLKAKLIGTRRSKERKDKEDKRSLYRASIHITNHKRNIKKGIELGSIESCSCGNRQDESCSCVGRQDES